MPTAACWVLTRAIEILKGEGMGIIYFTVAGGAACYSETIKSVICQPPWQFAQQGTPRHGTVHSKHETGSSPSATCLTTKGLSNWERFLKAITVDVLACSCGYFQEIYTVAPFPYTCGVRRYVDRLLPRAVFCPAPVSSVLTNGPVRKKITMRFVSTNGIRGKHSAFLRWKK